MKDYEPNPYFVWSVHLDGDKEDHDKSVCQQGTYDRAVAAIKAAKAKGFRCNINCTLFNNADPERMARFFDSVMEMGVDGITVSPGYAYERAPDQQHFLNRTATKQLFRDIFKRGNGGKKWSFSQSGLFLDFLTGNQTYKCTPWGNPTRTVFGWQRPCYLIGEGYAKTFKELMETTDWDSYGVGHYEKCADCMVHSGFEATAVMDSIAHPLKLLKLRNGVKTDGAMAPDIDLYAPLVHADTSSPAMCSKSLPRSRRKRCVPRMRVSRWKPRNSARSVDPPPSSCPASHRASTSYCIFIKTWMAHATRACPNCVPNKSPQVG